jgi:exonuclease SbcC
MELQARQSQITSVKTMQARVEQSAENDQRNLKELETALAGLPTLEECAELLSEVDDAEEALKLARREDALARQAEDAATKALTILQAEETTAWTRFNTARDPVAAYAAPAAAATVAASWELLATWAAGKRLEQVALQQAAREKEEASRAKVRELEETQVTLCEAAAVELRGRRPLEATIAAQSQAESELRYIDERLSQRGQVETNLGVLTEASRVAGILGLHLNASHFERWYLEEAMTRLVQSATQRLADLSQGQYSLGLNHNKTDFVVVDHINANEERPIRTLSGGETFLASLALALALGDDISQLAANGAARLDALFLDEGFGTLDPSTLETVASAIEELGARGRMVGIVTHVPELADRLPVQYRVSKTGGTSRVERVETR